MVLAAVRAVANLSEHASPAAGSGASPDTDIVAHTTGTHLCSLGCLYCRSYNVLGSASANVATATFASNDIESAQVAAASIASDVRYFHLSDPNSKTSLAGTSASGLST